LKQKVKHIYELHGNFQIYKNKFAVNKARPLKLICVTNRKKARIKAHVSLEIDLQIEILRILILRKGNAK
jgi:hypothetical protein